MKAGSIAIIVACMLLAGCLPHNKSQAEEAGYDSTAFNDIKLYDNGAVMLTVPEDEVDNSTNEIGY